MHLLVQFYHVPRRRDVSVGQLRDMNQPVLLNTYIDECTECGNVRYDPRQFHPFTQVVQRMDVGEPERPDRTARIAARFGQLGKDICQRRQSDRIGYIPFQVYFRT